jgi:hypothetical protein
VAVRVRATEVEDGTLPPICVVTGEPAGCDWNVRYVSPAGWLVVLLFFGVLPYLLARTITQIEVRGRVPISEAGIALVRSRRRMRWSGALGALALAVLGVVVGVAADSWAIALSALVIAFAVWLVTAIRWMMPVSGEVEPSGRWVRLTGAHAAFARAIALRDGALTGR